MVAAPDVVVCFLAALAHNMLLIATSTVVVVMVVVFIYICGGIVAGYCGWIVVSKCICGCSSICSSIAANAYKLVSKCDCSKQCLHFVTN